MVLLSGKKVIGVGLGNLFVVVDEIVDVVKVVSDIVQGVSFDNNLLCIVEKEVIVVVEVLFQFMIVMMVNGVQVVSDFEEFVKLCFLLFDIFGI